MPLRKQVKPKWTLYCPSQSASKASEKTFLGTLKVWVEMNSRKTRALSSAEDARTTQLQIAKERAAIPAPQAIKIP